MAHVFIVNDDTFHIHLKYLFAGTGAKDYTCDFLYNNSIKLNSSREKLLVSMIADISRIRIGDSVIFYLQQTSAHEGMFFGSFKVIAQPFLVMDEYLNEELGKNLVFRVKLSKDTVFSKGITERECLDSLDGISHPSQMCWSLIYRKLTGNRGCTMINDYEYKTIMSKLAKKNNNQVINSNNFDFVENSIVGIDEQSDYTGGMASLNIKNRLLFKKRNNQAFESHLQAYILQNLESIAPLKLKDSNISWIGNEISCGVGMQRIDIGFIQENSSAKHLYICELKDEPINVNIINQIKKYVEWCSDYIVPLYTEKIVIHPIIIAPCIDDETQLILSDIKNTQLKIENIFIENIKYISFTEVNNEIEFKEE